MKKEFGIGRSRIAGWGLVARRIFQIGEEIIKIKEPEIKDYYLPGASNTHPNDIGIGVGLWCRASKKSPWRWINHSCDPNLGFLQTRTLIAKKTILPGDELTLDYSLTEVDPWWSLVCRCGSKQCRHQVSSFQYLPRKLKIHYQSWAPDWVLAVDRLFQTTPKIQAESILQIQSGGVLSYPTESFYALGVKATDSEAIRQLFRVKRREAGKPIALIGANLAQVKKFFFMTKYEERLAKKHWPGSLTILLKPKKTIAARALGAARIGIRVPAHAGARRLAAKVGSPITATSANISGHQPTKSAAKVKRNFPGILVVSGKCGRARLPSTIIQVLGKSIHIIRQGAVKI